VSLLKHADSALSRAKAEEKRGRCFFDPEINVHMRE
jgi:hypothetical protein